MMGWLGGAIAMQLAAAASAELLTVRVGDRTRTVPVVQQADGATVSLDALAKALEGTMTRTSARSVRLEVGQGTLELRAGSVYGTSGADTTVLVFPAARRGSDWWVPLSMATDLLPRISGTSVLYDAERREMRRFAPITAAPRPLRPATLETHDASPATNAVGSTMRAATSASPATSAGTPVAGRQRVVVVDAGHGGPDNGMAGPIGGGTRVLEKHITLAMAQAVRRALESRGVQVVMTRTTDTLVALGDRGRIANKARGDVFVSIHVNAANPRWANPGSARGFETYFLAEAKTEDERRVAAMENEAVRFEAALPSSADDPLGFIMRDMAQNEHLRESLRLAELVQQEMKSVHPGPSRGVKQAGFMVLVTAFMPAVLVEVGFGSNRAESAYLSDSVRQAELAEHIAEGVVRYLNQYERKVGGGGA
jgi:N-acetylmuramoyl-L-alanine amidase